MNPGTNSARERLMVVIVEAGVEAGAQEDAQEKDDAQPCREAGTGHRPGCGSTCQWVVAQEAAPEKVQGGAEAGETIRGILSQQMCPANIQKRPRVSRWRSAADVRAPPFCFQALRNGPVRVS